MTTYVITDWLGLVPLFICAVFGIFGYLIFEMIPINYRPILINGVLEASYPSSTTLLVLSVMPTLVEQVNRRVRNAVLRITVTIFSIIFSSYTVIGLCAVDGKGDFDFRVFKKKIMNKPKSLLPGFLQTNIVKINRRIQNYGEKSYES